MDKRILLNQVRSYWPEAITLRPDGGLDALNNIYWPLDAKLGDDDEWIKLAAWAFHQSLSEIAETSFDAGRAVLRTAEVSLEAFDRWMKHNLADDAWSGLREEYEAGFNWS